MTSLKRCDSIIAHSPRRPLTCRCCDMTTLSTCWRSFDAKRGCISCLSLLITLCSMIWKRTKSMDSAWYATLSCLAQLPFRTIVSLSSPLGTCRSLNIDALLFLSMEQQQQQPDLIAIDIIISVHRAQCGSTCGRSSLPLTFATRRTLFTEMSSRRTFLCHVRVLSSCAILDLRGSLHHPLEARSTRTMLRLAGAHLIN